MPLYDEASFEPVWKTFDDEHLESVLFDYLWLAANTPNGHAGRIAQLKREAERRGRPEIIERAEARSRKLPRVGQPVYSFRRP